MTTLFAASLLATVAASDPLEDLQRKAFDYFWEQSNSSTGFTKDRAANFSFTDSYTVASCASTGFAMAATALGADRGWVDRATALSRAQATIYNVRVRWAQTHGWLYHFVDWRTGQRASASEVSSIDTVIFLMGAIVAEKYFDDPALTNHVESMLSAVDWQWMLTNGGSIPNSKTFCMGWVPESGFLGSRWDNYSELMGLYILGLGKWPAMPSSCWDAWSRHGVVYDGYQCLTGGPLFMHQMTHVFMAFDGRRDRQGYDYGFEAKQATLANRKYCVNNPKGYVGFGANFWGLSAGDTPDGYVALGAPGNIVDNGTIIPTSAVCSVQEFPTYARSLVDNLLANYSYSYGRYGFSNGINPTRIWVGNDVIGIDLGMMMLGISNSQDEFARKRVMSHQAVKQGMARAGFRLVEFKSGPGTSQQG
ncbi:MAG: hypothetical protein JSS66_17765 [Armatimonadetes bacterium]|nr:hypothetical protein [Armatimonadota bacterium]